MMLGTSGVAEAAEPTKLVGGRDSNRLAVNLVLFEYPIRCWRSNLGPGRKEKTFQVVVKLEEHIMVLLIGLHGGAHEMVHWGREVAELGWRLLKVHSRLLLLKRGVRL
jgi:hypothetical protein